MNFPQTITKRLSFISFSFLFVWLSTIFSFADKTKDFATAFNSLSAEFHIILAGIVGLGTLTAFLVFIVHMIKLGSIGNAHPIIRKTILNDILVSGITTALLGAVGLIYALIYYTANG